MRFQPTPLALAVATALGTLAALPAQAVLVIGDTASFTGTDSVTDTCGTVNATVCPSGATSTPPQTLAAPTLNQFDANTGVLIGTTIELDSTRTQTISGSLADGIATKTVGEKTFPGSNTTGAGSSDAELAAPGVSDTFGTVSTSGSATVPLSSTTASFGPTSDGGTATNTSLAVGDSDLNSYVGGSTVTVNLTAPTLFQADSTFTNGEKNKTTSTATYQLDWSGDVGVTYEYLLHAAPSFDDDSSQLTLNLDFGTLFLDQDASAQNFSIFNLLATDRIGLDLDSISGSGDTTKFNTDLAAFLGLAAGDSNGFFFDFDTSELGDFSASYSLDFSDEDLGASDTWFSYSGFVMNVMGSVIAANGNGTHTSVPAPSVLALLGSGLVALGMSWRKRR